MFAGRVRTKLESSLLVEDERLKKLESAICPDEDTGERPVGTVRVRARRNEESQ